MKETSEKKQVATIWLLTILILILVAVMVTLIIITIKIKREANIKFQEEQIQQQLAQTQKKTEDVKNTSSQTENNDKNIELNKLVGKYNVIPDKNLIYDTGLGRTLDDMEIELKENSEFTIYDSWGTSYYGNYTVDEDYITLNITDWYGESGARPDYIFVIREEAQIKLKENDGILEVIEAPTKIKTGIYSEGHTEEKAKENVLNIKNGLTYSKTNSTIQDSTTTQANVILDGKYVYGDGHEIWQFNKEGLAEYGTDMAVNQGQYKMINEDRIEIHYTKRKEWKEVISEDGESSIEVTVSEIDAYEYITFDKDNNMYLTNSRGYKGIVKKIGDVTVEDFEQF